MIIVLPTICICALIIIIIVVCMRKKNADGKDGKDNKQVSDARQITVLGPLLMREHWRN